MICGLHPPPMKKVRHYDNVVYPITASVWDFQQRLGAVVNAYKRRTKEEKLPIQSEPGPLSGECKMLRERSVRVMPPPWNLETRLERMVNECKEE